MKLAILDFDGTITTGDSFIRMLGFALTKTEPLIWETYVRRLAPETPPELLEGIGEDWEGAWSLVNASSPQGALSDRRWLRESIHSRAPIIHPLNLLQIMTLVKPVWTAEDEQLFRETVTGIAAGMLTTG